MNHDCQLIMDIVVVQPVEVWTKCGHRGRIKEPVGTHGMSFRTRKF